MAIERVNFAGWTRDDAEQAIEEKLNEIIDAVNALLAVSAPKTINEAGEVVPFLHTEAEHG